MIAEAASVLDATEHTHIGDGLLGRWLLARDRPQGAAAHKNPAIAKLLVRRGVTSTEEARKFLSPRLDDLASGALLPEMAQAIQILAAAVRQKSRICVYGDYDVDGLTASAVLVRLLTRIGCETLLQLPNRKTTGYGLHTGAVQRAVSEGCSLLVTVDCGISANRPIELAKRAGLNVVVLDHHHSGGDLPPADAVVTPHLLDDEAGGLAYLTGVGLAYKAGVCLLAELGIGSSSFAEKYLDLVVLGTLADVAALRGETHHLAKLGLEQLRRTRRPGLVALAATAGIDLAKCSERDVSFGLAPRLNAAGRLAEPEIASELLLAETLEAVGDKARELNRLNTERRAIQEKVFQEAEESLQPFIGEDTNFLVAAGEGWHGGVVGIVASKLSEKYGVPAAVLTIGEDGIARGSGRSPEWFHLCEALESCAQYLEGYGGHSCAAGLSTRLENLDVLREELNRVASERMADLDIQPGIEIEAELPLGAIDQEVAETVEALGPFGPLNPEPLLLATSVEVKSAQPTADGVHLRLMLAEGSRVIPGIAFGLAEDLAEFGAGDVVDVCYNLGVNRFNGGESPQMIVRDLRRADWKPALTSPTKRTDRT